MNEYTPTYILTWNPKKFVWNSYPEIVKRYKKGEVKRLDWSCRSKTPKAGDRFILMLQGMGAANGVVGTGKILSGVYSEGYDHEFYGDDFVDVEFESLIDYKTDDYVKTSLLKSMFPEQCWVPQMSGTRIKASILPDLWKLLKGEL